MASPQIHNGYTKIANELLEHLILDAKVTVAEMKILLFVIRKTYGYHKKIDRISLSQFVTGTGSYQANICRDIKSLVKKNLLFKKDGHYKLNKNWETWKGVASELVANQLVANQLIGSSQPATGGSSQPATHKRKGKDNIQKKGWEDFKKLYQIKANK